VSCTERQWTAQISPLLLVLSGPSGVGKDAALDMMKAAHLPFHFVVTATTRQKRPGERDGLDYHFLSEDGFRQQIGSNQFLEWAKVYGNYYGVPAADISNALKRGQDVIVKVDVQGAATIKRIVPEAVFVFLMPPSEEELANRLGKRQGQPLAELRLRLDKAKEEMKRLSIFDYVVVSQKDKLDIAVSQINAIVLAEKCRVKPRVIKL